MSVASHRSKIPEEDGYIDGFGSNVPSHHTSKLSIYSSVSRGGDGTELVEEDEWQEKIVSPPADGHFVDVPSRDFSRGPSRSASRTSVKYDGIVGDEWDNNEQVFGGSGVSHASRHSLRSGYGSKVPSHHVSKVSIESHAGGDAGIVPFSTSRPHSVHASRGSIYSHAAGDHGFGSRAPSHHASRASIQSHVYGEEEEEEDDGGVNGFIPDEEERKRTSRTSTRENGSMSTRLATYEEDDEERVKMAEEMRRIKREYEERLRLQRNKLQQALDIAQGVSSPSVAQLRNLFDSPVNEQTDSSFSCRSLFSSVVGSFSSPPLEDPLPLSLDPRR